MRLFISLAVLVLSLLSLSEGGLVGKKVAGEKTILCYYGSWSCYRYGNGKYDIEVRRVFMLLKDEISLTNLIQEKQTN